MNLLHYYMVVITLSFILAAFVNYDTAPKFSYYLLSLAVLNTIILSISFRFNL